MLRSLREQQQQQNIFRGQVTVSVAECFSLAFHILGTTPYHQKQMPHLDSTEDERVGLLLLSATSENRSFRPSGKNNRSYKMIECVSWLEIVNVTIIDLTPLARHRLKTGSRTHQ